MEQFIIVFNEELVVDGSKNSYSTELFSHTISLENVKQVTKDSHPHFQCIISYDPNIFKYCKGEELLDFKESHEGSIICSTYNSDIKL